MYSTIPYRSPVRFVHSPAQLFASSLAYYLIAYSSRNSPTARFFSPRHEKILYNNIVESAVKRTCTCNFNSVRDGNTIINLYQLCIYILDYLPLFCFPLVEWCLYTSIKIKALRQCLGFAVSYLSAVFVVQYL